MIDTRLYREDKHGIMWVLGEEIIFFFFLFLILLFFVSILLLSVFFKLSRFFVIIKKYSFVFVLFGRRENVYLGESWNANGIARGYEFYTAHSNEALGEDANAASGTSAKINEIKMKSEKNKYPNLFLFSIVIADSLTATVERAISGESNVTNDHYMDDVRMSDI